MELQLLKCTKCKDFKPTTDFGRDGSRIGRGFSYRCKKCASDHKKSHYKRHKLEVNTSNSQWYKLNKSKRYLAGQKWAEQNKTAARAISNRWQKKRIAIDPLFALARRIRINLLHCLKSKGFTKSRSTSKVIGCTWNELFKYLGPRPSSNHELDHICPLSQAQTENEIYSLNHYSNLQWLTREANKLKSDNPTNEAIQMCQKLLGRDWIGEICESVAA